MTKKKSAPTIQTLNKIATAEAKAKYKNGPHADQGGPRAGLEPTCTPICWRR